MNRNKYRNKLEVVGLDFGTTNSALCVASFDNQGRPQTTLAHWSFEGAEVPTFRSVLYMSPNDDDPDLPPRVAAGPRAIESYLSGYGEGRLIQSAKSFLASRAFVPTDFFGFEYALEDLIGLMIEELRRSAEAQLGELPTSVVVGRPVRFAGARTELDNEIALGRLESALRQTGFEEVHFEYEPVAAAYQYATGLDEPQHVLIGDFGGGTSDFSLVIAQPGGRECQILGTAGRGIAGDAFDAAIVRKVVAPRLGRGSEFRGVFGTVLPVPSWLYTHLEHWHRLSFLKNPNTMSVLREFCRTALDSAPFEAFVHLVEEDRGYALYRAVEATKRRLSSESQTLFHYEDLPAHFEAEIKRRDFETWVQKEIDELSLCLDELLAQAGVDSNRVDRLFLTGGSSFVPAVRTLFERRFPGAEIARGGELTSVACGLGLRGLEMMDA